MKIRSEINSLASAIRNAAENYNGGNTLFLNGFTTTIRELNRHILKTMDDYELQERSLNGRIVTAKNLSDALNLLNTKASSQISGINSPTGKLYEYQTLILDAIQKTKIFIESAEKIRSDLYKNIEPGDEKEINNKFIVVIEKTTTESIIQNLFRTIKNILPVEREYCKNMEGFYTRPFAGYLHLKFDLEHFLSNYIEIITEWQRSQITELLSLLNQGFQIDKKLSVKHLLPHGIKIPSEVIEADIADIVYEIETSIENLELGQRFLFPGGLDKNRHVLFEVQRIRDREFRFAVLNTGAEADFGQEFWQKDVKLTDGFLDQARTPIFSNLPMEAVADPVFLEELIRFQLEQGKPSLKDTIYKTIVNQLIKKYPGKQSVRELHGVQAWGPTSFDPVLAYVEYALPPSLFVPFQLDMMLRARMDLNDKIPQGRAEAVFESPALDFIDKKSCETVAEWKKRFDTHCQLTPNDDLFLARSIVEIAQATDVAKFRAHLDSVQDCLIDKYKLEHNPGLFFGSIYIINYLNLILDVGGMVSCAVAPLTGGASLPFCINHFAINGALYATNSLIRNSFWQESANSTETKNYLKSFEKLLKIHSSEQYFMMERRNEEFGWVPTSQKNRPTLVNLYLDKVLDFLKDKYSEISFCIAQPLVNATISPLKEVIEGCNRLQISIK